MRPNDKRPPWMRMPREENAARAEYERLRKEIPTPTHKRVERRFKVARDAK